MSFAWILTVLRRNGSEGHAIFAYYLGGKTFSVVQVANRYRLTAAAGGLRAPFERQSRGAAAHFNLYDVARFHFLRRVPKVRRNRASGSDGVARNAAHHLVERRRGLARRVQFALFE